MKSKKNTWIRALGKVLFILYVSFIIYFLLFSDLYGRVHTDGYSYNFIPLKEIKRFWIYRNELGFYATFTNLAGNILIFLPFGFFLPMASRYRSFLITLLYSFLLSLCIETLQLLTMIGSFDVDDLMLNTLGGMLGYLIYAVISFFRRNHVYKKK
ncbi:glycopeptide antibiotics resistance protein [Aequitasia blattaphilus]|uniref:VanZ family protein n=1 Tax=Aequitasia blattaphilus TaxID=2949332 RepID=A0ABT1EDU4_9FIRM|nr:VanZ family protein [Aequitasia blattaphilus]MCP1102637.1 VanZ family protein [Aequitasia blattaphilus]MCR8615277.1 VanZ family protein [Aequitasia blattaphilus]